MDQRQQQFYGAYGAYPEVMTDSGLPRTELVDRTPTPESEQEPQSPERGMPSIPDGTFNVMPWMAVHPACPVQQQPQQGHAVPKVFPGQMAPQMAEGCTYRVPMNQPQQQQQQQQPMDNMWQSLYQPPAYQPPPMTSGTGEQQGMPFGLSQDQLQALEHDPDLAAIFQDIRRHGPAAALRAFQDEELMMKISKKNQGPPVESKSQGSSFSYAQGQGSMPQSTDAKSGAGPIHGVATPAPKAQGVPHAGGRDGYGCPLPSAQAMMPPRAQGHQQPQHQHQQHQQQQQQHQQQHQQRQPQHHMGGPPPPKHHPGGVQHQGGAAAAASAQQVMMPVQGMAPASMQQQQQQLQQPGRAKAASSDAWVYQGLKAVDASSVISGIQKMDGEVVNQVVLNTIHRLPWSVCLADPSLDDCPIVGCSDGFEVLTGYTRKEILGKNCRFLNEGTDLKAEVKGMLREAAASRGEFLGSLPNKRKNGELFENLLHMTTLTVKGKRFIIGIQADVTNLSIDMDDPGHVEELQSVAARIFSGNIDAWVQMQVREFSIRQPMPYSKVLMRSDPSKFLEAMESFVHIQCDTRRSSAMQDPDAHPSTKRGVHPADHAALGDGEQALPARRTDVRRGPTASEPETQRPVPSQHESLEDPEQNKSTATALKSVGSAGHPDNCQAECVFHFFRGGCKGGADCRFCHEFHPRKNPKKNRRALRRYIANAGTNEDGTVAAGSSMDEFSTCNNFDEVLIPVGPAGGDQADPARQVSEAPSASELPSNFEFAPDKERQGLVSVCYGPGQAVALMTGMRLRLVPQVEIAAGGGDAVPEGLRFSVEPPLPAGLSLEGTSGVISGVPTHSASSQAYSITVGTEAIGLGSMKLGLVPIAVCTLMLAVVDMRAYTVTWGSEDEDGRLKVFLQQGT